MQTLNKYQQKNTQLSAQDVADQLKQTCARPSWLTEIDMHEILCIEEDAKQNAYNELNLTKTHM